MKKAIFIISTIIITLCTTINSFGQKTLNKIIKNKEIRVGMTLNQPPFNLRSMSWEPMGLDVDIAELLAESMNVKLTIVEMPFHELLPSLESGKIDAIVSGMTITPERNLKASFVGPYMVSGKSILTKSATLAESDESEDLNKKELKIGALKGSTSEKFVNNFLKMAQLTLFDSYKDGVKLLMDDKVQAIVADYPVCILAQLRYPEAGFESLEEPLTIEPIGVALPANDPLLTNLVQNYFNSLMLTGILDEVQEYWFENPAWLSQVKDIQIMHHDPKAPIY